ncbi:hypothetical protein A176_001931 [Myxococcus hansupus]|uniref:Uncharacterized protein n=1 Tax=Pseudomyxococcus hansupus TaxID=1297742 RepID=A0A0H4WQI3_9BACT|nr:hypothetical protein A176_001931 [Myxococcus hansupus]
MAARATGASPTLQIDLPICNDGFRAGGPLSARRRAGCPGGGEGASGRANSMESLSLRAAHRTGGLGVAGSCQAFTDAMRHPRVTLR